MREIERYYYKHEYPKVQKALEEFKKENVDELIKKRIPVLMGLVKSYQYILDHCNSYINNCDNSYLPRLGMKRFHELCSGRLKKIKREIREIESYRNDKKEDNKPKITDPDICVARGYPITKIITFDRYNKARCISLDHYDEHPSMHYFPDTNEVHCFSCGYHQDAIGVYQALNNSGFKEAVLELESRI